MSLMVLLIGFIFIENLLNAQIIIIGLIKFALASKKTDSEFAVVFIF